MATYNPFYDLNPDEDDFIILEDGENIYEMDDPYEGVNAIRSQVRDLNPVKGPALAAYFKW